MAAGGGGVDGSVGGDAGIEFYRVLLTGIPPVPNQEVWSENEIAYCKCIHVSICPVVVCERQTERSATR